MFAEREARQPIPVALSLAYLCMFVAELKSEASNRGAQVAVRLYVDIIYDCIIIDIIIIITVINLYATDISHQMDIKII